MCERMADARKSRLEDLRFADVPVKTVCGRRESTKIERHAVVFSADDRRGIKATIVRSNVYGHPYAAQVILHGSVVGPYAQHEHSLSTYVTPRGKRRTVYYQDDFPNYALVAIIRGWHDLTFASPAVPILWHEPALAAPCWHAVSRTVDEFGDDVLCNFIDLAIAARVEGRADG